MQVSINRLLVLSTTTLLCCVYRITCKCYSRHRAFKIAKKWWKVTFKRHTRSRVLALGVIEKEANLRVPEPVW